MGNGEWGVGKRKKNELLRLAFLPIRHSPLPSSVFGSVVAIPGADAEFGVFRDLDRDAAEFAVAGLIGGVVTKQVLRLQLSRYLVEDLGQVLDLVGQERHPTGLISQR